MRSDNARMERYGNNWLKWLHEMLVSSQFSEPKNQQQNPVELCAIKWLKDNIKVLRARTGAPANVWLQAGEYLVDIHNITSDEMLDFDPPHK